MSGTARGQQKAFVSHLSIDYTTQPRTTDVRKTRNVTFIEMQSVLHEACRVLSDDGEFTSQEYDGLLKGIRD